MPRSKDVHVEASEGYWPDSPLVGEKAVQNGIIDGQNIFLLSTGKIKSARGPSNKGGVGGTRCFNINDQAGALTGTGSAISYLGNTFWWVSDADISIGDPSAGTTTRTLPASGGVPQYYLSGDFVNRYNVGLAAPADAPVISDSGITGKNTGAYSVMLTRRRSQTGGESNPSPMSNSLTVKAKKITIITPVAGTGVNSHDKWGIYVCHVGLPTVGPWFYLKDVDATQGVTSTFTLDWNEGELASLEPPTDHDPPPSGANGPKFIVSFGQVIFLLGTYGGTFINSSVPGDPESYPGGFIAQLTPPGQIVGFCPGGFEGEIYIWTKDSLMTAIYTGSANAPIRVSPKWNNFGFQSPHGACVVNNILYGFGGDGQFVRMSPDGTVDREFAKPIRSKVANLGYSSASAVVGYDPTMDSVIFIFGSTAYAYNMSINRWSTPIDCSAAGTANGCVTYGGNLYVSFNSVFWKWEGGASGGTKNWYYVVLHKDDQNFASRKTYYGSRTAHTVASLTVKVTKNLGSTAVETITDNGSGARLTNWTRKNSHYHTLQFRYEGLKADEEIEYTVVDRNIMSVIKDIT